MKKLIAIAFLLSVVPWNPIFSSVDAASENVCVNRSKFIKRLKQRYEERQVSNGINYNGVVVEIFVSDKGHFTILATSPDGVSCLIASGDSWQEKPILKTDVGI